MSAISTSPKPIKRRANNVDEPTPAVDAGTTDEPINFDDENEKLKEITNWSMRLSFSVHSGFLSTVTTWIPREKKRRESSICYLIIQPEQGYL